MTQRELLSSLQHLIWSRWMKWMFQQGTFNADGTWTMPSAKVERWMRQMTTQYVDLPDHERNSDREIADEIITAINAWSVDPSVLVTFPNQEPTK